MYQRLSIIAFLLFFPLHGLVIINTPGNFVYGADNIGDPASANEAIIRIDVSNVSLDFRGRSIYQLPGNTQLGLDGILISPNISNVTIKNVII